MIEKNIPTPFCVLSLHVVVKQLTADLGFRCAGGSMLQEIYNVKICLYQQAVMIHCFPDTYNNRQKRFKKSLNKQF